MLRKLTRFQSNPLYNICYFKFISTFWNIFISAHDVECRYKADSTVLNCIIQDSRGNLEQTAKMGSTRTMVKTVIVERKELVEN